jgi:UDPglucose 6-dehydrogenase
VDGADAAMIVTEWPELRDVPWEQARAAMAGPVLLDGRNLLDPQAMAGAGFTYLSVGRSTTRP